jgi:predicted ATPase
MLSKIEITDFKCLSNQLLEFGALNVITGLNSTGKSSVIQALLLFCEAVDHRKSGRVFVVDNFEELRNKYRAAREIKVAINDIELAIKEENAVFSNDFDAASHPVLDNGVYYLSENRTGPEELAERSKKSIVGEGGRFLFNRFETNKSNPIHETLVREGSQTLSSNVDYWLSFILGVEIELTSQVVTSTTIKVNFNFDKLSSLSPFQLGAGVSYLAKILILGLLSKPGDIVIIENPEVHLHPGAQSKLGCFFAFLANAGIQVILETHCEHLINRIRFEVYSGSIADDKVKLFYKSNHLSPFTKIFVNRNGQYIDENSLRTSFPSGFFDSTLRELLEIG